MLSCPSQAAVEVPQYVGVNLLVEGAPIRRSRPPHRQLITTQLFSDQSSSEMIETIQKSSGEKSSKVAAFCCSDKENQAVEEKKKQQTARTAKRACEGRTDVQKTSYVRRSRRDLVSEQPPVAHTEPQRKTQRLGLGDNGAPLVPLNLSFSLGPPNRVAHYKCEPRAGHANHISRSFLPHFATLERKHRTTSQVLPSLRGPLPAMEAFSLRPNIVAGSSLFHNPNMSARSTVHRQQLFHCSRRQQVAKYSRDCGE